MNNKNRQGRFTSSQMYRVMGTPAVLNTYIEELVIEKRMKRCLDVGAYSQAMSWGRYMEMQVFKEMSTDYTIVSKQTILHPEDRFKDIWSGSPDFIKFKGNDAVAVSEVKCYYPKAFAKLTDAMLKKDLKALKEVNTSSGKGREYWQVVSNAILCGVDTAEIITYMPYESEMEQIKNDVANFDGADQWEFRFINERSNSELPVLPNDGYYKNLNVFSFIVPEEDKQLLEERILMAEEKIQHYKH